MKKVLSFVLLALTISLSAQTTTYFAKPLELKSVPASFTKSDSVLVRGADKIVKFVPRSEFSTGGGVVTPTSLDQTLTVGNTSNKEILLQGSTGNFTTENGTVTTWNGSERTTLVRMDGSQAKLIFGNAFGGSASIGVDNVRNFMSFQLPNISDFERTLAVSVGDDYADNSGKIQLTSLTMNKEDSGVFMLSGSGPFLGNTFYISNGSEGTQFRQGLGSNSLLSYSSLGEGEITTNAGNVTIRVKVGSNETTLGFENPIFSGGNITFPAVSDTRPYKVSLAEVYTNASTTDLSAATLNSTYNQAKSGDRVHCMAISTGAKIYEKTAIGWVTHVVTVTP